MNLNKEIHVEAAQEWVSSSDELFVRGLNVSEPGLLTSSLQVPPRRSFVGIHCDSFSGRPIPNPREDPTRLCLNLSRGPRYFLFMAEPLIDPEFHNEPIASSAVDLTTRYFDRVRAAPVLRLRIDPGEAYLAATGNILHDATTAGTDYIDVNYSVTGHFDVNQLAGKWTR